MLQELKIILSLFWKIFPARAISIIPDRPRRRPLVEIVTLGRHTLESIRPFCDGPCVQKLARRVRQAVDMGVAGVVNPVAARPCTVRWGLKAGQK